MCRMVRASIWPIELNGRSRDLLQGSAISCSHGASLLLHSWNNTMLISSAAILAEAARLLASYCFARRQGCTRLPLRVFIYAPHQRRPGPAFMGCVAILPPEERSATCSSQPHFLFMSRYNDVPLYGDQRDLGDITARKRRSPSSDGC